MVSSIIFVVCYDRLYYDTLLCYVVLFCTDLRFIILLYVLHDAMLQYLVLVCIVIYNMYYFGFFSYNLCDVFVI